MQLGAEIVEGRRMLARFETEVLTRRTGAAVGGDMCRSVVTLVTDEAGRKR